MSNMWNALPKKFVNSTGMRFKLILPGVFMMGDNDLKNSRPVHKVEITEPFYLGVFPVTQREWKIVMGTNPSYFKGDDLPVENVSWYDCKQFINKLNVMEGNNVYRLPTEAEWEYACRAGSESKYCFGDDVTLLHDYAWFDENSDDMTHPVGTKKPNKWGLYDMHGNVWEWCQDVYDESYYEHSPSIDPQGPSKGKRRGFRGGSFYDPDLRCTSANRYGFPPDYSHEDIGFRVLRIVDDMNMNFYSFPTNQLTKKLM